MQGRRACSSRRASSGAQLNLRSWARVNEHRGDEGRRMPRIARRLSAPATEVTSFGAPDQRRLAGLYIGMIVALFTRLGDDALNSSCIKSVKFRFAAAAWYWLFAFEDYVSYEL
jgi:hypothetical protein